MRHHLLLQFADADLDIEIVGVRATDLVEAVKDGF